MRIGVTAAAVVLSAAGVFGLVACTGEPAGGTTPVIAPGKPGEAAATLTEGATAPEVPPNEADLEYVQMMIAHHGQALEMTALAPDRASHETVKGLASRIADSQGPEVEAMKTWQNQRGGPHAAHGSHDHSTMPGMASAEQLAQLAAASGAEFDRLFVQLMTTHHEGAIQMANDVLTKGSTEYVEEMATDVIATQSDEIARMRALGLG
ncbi:DUF305 domain-containing protein [Umezawaea beigongshangensis]|uniref:DUF305 domain-containing protein n=1 Tax=Umezawaea beigongshangensis TaxID=2780383 RepID=UPI0018F245B0|nr:DUF305 domain-containing protein [Umezawaea beigongshangensis]